MQTLNQTQEALSLKSHEPFAQWLANFQKTMRRVFYEQNNIAQFIQHRGFPEHVINELMQLQPFAAAIPLKYGGRGNNPKEILSLLQAAAYESLPLSLMFGINMGLFLQPVAKYAQNSVKRNIFHRFLMQNNMGGLMITEPDFGSDALNMRTYNEKRGKQYHISGTKHWQGLTGMADFWIITSRRKNDDNSLQRDIDFFICDTHEPSQQIVVEEFYNNIGLYPIPYGKNKLDILVPEEFKLQSESNGLKLMMDLLHRSRFQFPGMAAGFIQRMLDEAIKQVTTRFVGGKPLFSLDVVKHQITKIQSAFTVSSAMCLRSAEYSSIENDLSPDGIESAAIKAYITDLMQESAQISTQLMGANGYKAENVTSRGILDSRPFQIFEGSNDMLYTQIAEGVLRQMKKQKLSNLSDYFKWSSITNLATNSIHQLPNFQLNFDLPQRKLVDLGKIISRVIAAQMVINMGLRGFRADLVNQSIENLAHDIKMYVGSFHSVHKSVAVIEYDENSSWLNL